MSESLLDPPSLADADTADTFLSDESLDIPVTVIKRRAGMRFIDWRELVEYRDLYIFLSWRLIKVRYAQSAIGIGWAIIQPVCSMVIFTVIFGGFAKVSSDGVPYSIFSLAALVPWTYFSNALTDGANSLVSNANMITKIYFPRLLMPLSSITAKLLDFAIALMILAGMMIFYRMPPTFGVVMFPLLVLLMMMTAAGLGMWLTALAIQYRDVKHAMNFVVQILMYASPVVYATSIIPEEYQLLYAINPMVGVIEGFRSCLLATRPMPWDLLAVGTVSSSLIALSGAIYFRNKERLFADVA